MSIEPHVQAALIRGKERLFAAHGRDRNFTGCGVGFRRRAGQVTDEPVIIAMVEHKLPDGAVTSRLKLPATVEVDGVSYGVDVVEAGPVFASSAREAIRPDAISTTGPIVSQFTPLVQGCSIQNVNAADDDLGTLGCFVVDNVDFTVCMLSAGHVLANDDLSSDGEVIIQPAAADNDGYNTDVATLKRFVQTEDNPSVDAAIAQVDQQSSSGWQPTFAEDLMPPISASHPAVGMCIASDYYYNSFLARMDLTVQALNVTIANATDTETNIVAPEVGTNIEKVGRTSGYTSAVVDAVAVSVNVTNNDGSVAVMDNMIWSQWLSIGGDSGAVACLGGPGDVYIVPAVGGCQILSAVETYYEVSATNLNQLTTATQNVFLSKSLTGNLAINLIYMNGQVIIDRLTADTGDAYNQATAQAYAQEYYAKYYDIIGAALNDPDSTDPVITQDLCEDYYTFWEFLSTDPADGGAGIITQDEADAAFVLLIVLLSAVGQDYQQFLAYLNEESIYSGLYTAAVSAGTLEVP